MSRVKTVAWISICPEPKQRELTINVSVRWKSMFKTAFNFFFNFIFILYKYITIYSISHAENSTIFFFSIPFKLLRVLYVQWDKYPNQRTINFYKEKSFTSLPFRHKFTSDHESALPTAIPLSLEFSELNFCLLKIVESYYRIHLLRETRNPGFNDKTFKWHHIIAR